MCKDPRGTRRMDLQFLLQKPKRSKGLRQNSLAKNSSKKYYKHRTLRDVYKDPFTLVYLLSTKYCPLNTHNSRNIT